RPSKSPPRPPAAPRAARPHPPPRETSPQSSSDSPPDPSPNPSIPKPNRCEPPHTAAPAAHAVSCRSGKPSSPPSQNSSDLNRFPSPIHPQSAAKPAPPPIQSPDSST